MADGSNSSNRQVNGVEDSGSLLEAARRELKTWTTKVEEAEDKKGRLTMEKLDEDEAKKVAQQEMMNWVEKQKECESEFTHSMKAVQDEILKVDQCRQHLLEKLQRCKAELEAKRAETMRLKQNLKISALIPETEVVFTARSQEDKEDESRPIRGQFSITQKPSVSLQDGQALVTFEDENVADKILKMSQFSVCCDDIMLDVKSKRINMDLAVKFEIHLDVSRKKLLVSNVPSCKKERLESCMGEERVKSCMGEERVKSCMGEERVKSCMGEERVKERLELSFSRPSRGGGEVEVVEYDVTSETAFITFLHPGVANSLALRGRHRVDLNPEVKVQVGPVYQYQLCKFQTFCGRPKRTVLLEDIEDRKDEDDVQDYLEIHFQKPSNQGGEIEKIKYVPKGKSLQAFFSED